MENYFWRNVAMYTPRYKALVRTESTDFDPVVNRYFEAQYIENGESTNTSQTIGSNSGVDNSSASASHSDVYKEYPKTVQNVFTEVTTHNEGSDSLGPTTKTETYNDLKDSAVHTGTTSDASVSSSSEKSNSATSSSGSSNTGGTAVASSKGANKSAPMSATNDITTNNIQSIGVNASVGYSHNNGFSETDNLTNSASRNSSESDRDVNITRNIVDGDATENTADMFTSGSHSGTSYENVSPTTIGSGTNSGNLANNQRVDIDGVNIITGLDFSYATGFSETDSVSNTASTASNIASTTANGSGSKAGQSSTTHTVNTGDETVRSGSVTTGTNQVLNENQSDGSSTTNQAVSYGAGSVIEKFDDNTDNSVTSHKMTGESQSSTAGLSTRSNSSTNRYTGREGLTPQEGLMSASDYLMNYSVAFKWFVNKLDSCFIMLYDV